MILHFEAFVFLLDLYYGTETILQYLYGKLKPTQQNPKEYSGFFLLFWDLIEGEKHQQRGIITGGLLLSHCVGNLTAV